MNDSQLRESMARLIDDEPPYVVHVPSILGRGRHELRRRRSRSVALTSLGVAAAVGTATLGVPAVVDWTADVPTSPGPAAAAPAGVTLKSSAAAPEEQKSSAPSKPQEAAAGSTQAASRTSVHEAIIAGIRSSTPTDWDLQLSERRTGGNWDVAGTADDGAGKGHIAVGAMRSRVGAMTVHPCNDPEFVEGAAECDERPQPDGRVLVVRSMTRSDRGHGTIYVSLFGTEGVSVTATAGNFTIDEPGTDIVTPEQKAAMMHVTRRDPLYTTQLLTKLVHAVDRNVQTCLDAGCDD